MSDTPRLVIPKELANDPWSQMSRIGAFAHELHVAAKSAELEGVQSIEFEVEYPPNSKGEVGVDLLTMDENGQHTAPVVSLTDG